MTKSYYAVIPAYIRYDQNLTPNAKLMFGEITALSNEKGYCFASNKYFSELYNVSVVSISKWINQLKEKKYIEVKMIYKKDSKEIEQRQIMISDIKYLLNKNKRGIKEILKDNNNILINKNTKEKEYNNNIDTGIIHIGRLFPIQMRPNTPKELNTWKDCLDKLDRIEGYDPRQVYYIVNKVRNDEFWRKNFFSLLKLRKKNKEGIKYIHLFHEKMCPELTK